MSKSSNHYIYLLTLLLTNIMHYTYLKNGLKGRNKMIRKIFSLVFRDIKQFTFMSLANSLPKNQLFDKCRCIFVRFSGSKVGKGCEIRTPFENRGAKNIEIGNNVFINSGVRFAGKAKIKIGNKVMIGPRVQLETTNHELNLNHEGLRPPYGKDIIIEDNVWIGAGAIILPGVRIGKGSVIAAGAVITKNVPKNVVVAGVPGKVLRDINVNLQVGLKSK